MQVVLVGGSETFAEHLETSFQGLLIQQLMQLVYLRMDRAGLGEAALITGMSAKNDQQLRMTSKLMRMQPFAIHISLPVIASGLYAEADKLKKFQHSFFLAAASNEALRHTAHLSKERRMSQVFATVRGTEYLFADDFANFTRTLPVISSMSY